MKTHNRDYFVKYMTSDTAKKVIDSLQVRWSSPLLFNDPFDTQFSLRFDFKDIEFEKALKAEIIKIVYGVEEPQGDDTHLFFSVLKILRSIRDRIPKEEYESETEKDIQKGIENGAKFLAEESSKWKLYLEDNRVFCVAEEYDNLLMWSHYGDMHKGVVIRFKCIPELDTALCAAIPVIYQKGMPVIASLEDWVKHLTGQKFLDFKPIYNRYISTKSQHWSYEREWRLVIPKKSNDNSLFEDQGIWPEEIDSVYLGCRISDTDQKEILEILKSSKLSHVKIYQASKNEASFTLDFKRIN